MLLDYLELHTVWYLPRRKVYLAHEGLKSGQICFQDIDAMRLRQLLPQKSVLFLHLKDSRVQLLYLVLFSVDNIRVKLLCP